MKDVVEAKVSYPQNQHLYGLYKPSNYEWLIIALLQDGGPQSKVGL